MATFKSDYSFGLKNEHRANPKLNKFFKTDLIYRGGYAPFDYDNGSTLYIELKSRRIPHDKYPTAIIGANKVEIASKNLDREYWFVYQYEDGLYGLKYEKEKFDTYEHSDYTRGERSDYNNKSQHCYFIPSSALLPLF
jgi:hypothetical protein